jgi:DNA-binding winged helix-turn-helix (wHTH) protein/tetratricopeptide (TPR) repeat protein
MTHVVYEFGDFLLDPLTRELRRKGIAENLPVSTVDCLIYLVQHRNRSVGRDELASAVWGRADVSEASLTQAIMRLRRVLGDASSIRTTPRLGYRWTFQPTHERPAEPPVAAQPPNPTPDPASNPSPDPAPTASPPPRRAPRRTWVAAASLAILAIAAAGAWWLHSRNAAGISGAAVSATSVSATSASVTTPTVPATGPLAVMVVPAQVDASSEWAWLRLGLMDLVANQLRDGGLTTTPSETTVGLINAGLINADSLAIDPSIAKVTTLLVKPRISQTGDAWNVRLSAQGPSGMQRVVEAQDRDALVAARRAADTLLVGLGHTPSIRPGAPEGVEELAQRIAAAGLAGQLDVARAIAARASPEQLARPEIALSLAYVDFYQGDYRASRARCDALLDEIPQDRDPRMRALVISQLGVIDFREQKFAEAGVAFDQALDLLKSVNDPKAKAAAFTGRGGVDVMAGRLDAAMAAMGQARLLHEMSNDAFGMARVDLNLGAIAMYRGQPLAAVPLFEETAERFQRLSVPEARDSALRSLAEAYAMLLEHDKALAATDRLGREDAQAPNTRERWWNVLSRAVALAGVGRLDEAVVLLDRIKQDSDPHADDAVRSEADAALADVAFARGDYHHAAATARAALTPALESANEQDYFGAWFTRIRALQGLGDRAGAAAESVRLEQWTARTPNDRRTLYLGLLKARQALIDGHAEASLAGFADALTRAERSGIPEDILAAATPYAIALVDAGKIDDASALAGRIAPWAERDLRSAVVAGRVHDAMHHPDAAQRALRRARELAGERPIAAPAR